MARKPSSLLRRCEQAKQTQVLKAHTQNRAGTVSLVSSNPRIPPNITFNYFSSGPRGGNWSYDLAAVVEGMKFARSIFATYAADTGTNVMEIVPGSGVQTDQELEQWVRDTSWGHHASCSCPIGKDGDAMAVLDGRFRVRGAKGLRVVDASVFVSVGSPGKGMRRLLENVLIRCVANDSWILYSDEHLYGE